MYVRGQDGIYTTFYGRTTIINTFETNFNRSNHEANIKMKLTNFNNVNECYAGVGLNLNTERNCKDEVNICHLSHAKRLSTPCSSLHTNRVQFWQISQLD